MKNYTSNKNSRDTLLWIILLIALSLFLGCTEKSDASKTETATDRIQDTLESIARGHVPSGTNFHLKRIRIQKDLASDMQDIMVDGSQMEQVFLNLIINAIEAVSEGGTIQINSTLNRTESFVNVEIKDNGPGISKMEQSKIFEPFFSTKPKGTGLGLSVSYGIIRNHRGAISVQSHLGEGTRFLIKIPFTQDGSRTLRTSQLMNRYEDSHYRR